MKYYILFAALEMCLIGSINSYGQSDDLTGAVSQNSNFSQGVANNQPDLSTGVLMPSIPLTGISQGNLGANFSLIYTSCSGVKVDQYAGYTGLGWQLNGIGTITRTIRGKRDEKKFGINDFASDKLTARGWLDQIQVTSYTQPEAILSSAQTDIPNATIACLVNYDKTNSVAPTSFTHSQAEWQFAKDYYYYGILHDEVDSVNFDSEPDLFNFNFAGYSGTFVFDETGKPVLLYNQDIKIEPAIGPQNSTYNGVSAWIFTTPDGSKYIFENVSDYFETTFELTPTGTPNIYGTATNESRTTQEYVSTWYLSKAKSVTGEEINYLYVLGNQLEYKYKFSVQSNSCDVINHRTGNSGNANALPITTQTNISTIRISSPHYLSEVFCNNGKIEFIYNIDFNRIDLAQNPLQFIRKYNSANSKIQEFEFSYTYFPSSCGTVDCNRLKLFSISQNSIGSNEKPFTYRFKYNQNTILPQRGSLNQDIWGLNNLNANNSIIPDVEVNDPNFSSSTWTFTGGDRSPDPQLSQTFVLSEIHNPLGGFVEYQYELNDYFDAIRQRNIYSGGLRIHKIITHDAVNESNNIVKEFKYVSASDPLKSSGEINYSLDLYQECRQFNFYYDPNLLEPDEPNFDFSRNFITRSSSPTFLHADDYLRYTRVEEISSGYGKVVYNLTGFSSNGDERPEQANFYYNVPVSENELLNINNVKGLYSDNSMERGLVLKTEIYLENGSLLREINNEYDFHPLNYTSQTIKGLKIFTQNYFTGFTSGQRYSAYNLEYYEIRSRWIYVRSSSTKSYESNSANPMVETIDYFYDNPQHGLLTRSKQTDSKGNIYESTTKYSQDYDCSLSNGNSISWPDLKASSIALMQLRHIDNIPIEQISRKTDIASGNISILGGSLSTFKVDANSGAIIPDATYKLTLKTPLSNASFPVSTINFANGAGQFSADWSHYTIVNQLDKLTVGTLRPIQVHGIDGISISKQWNSNSNIVIAEFKNAKYSADIIGDECDHEGFEDVVNIENWISNWSNRTTNEAHTGTESYLISPNSQGVNKEFLPTNQYQKYKLSAWVKTDPGFQTTSYLKLDCKADGASNGIYPSVNGASQSIGISNTNGKWKYKEIILDLAQVRQLANFSSNYAINPRIRIRCYSVLNDPTYGFWIDDIRFQPLLSQGSSVTIDPNTNNQTSFSDERNIPTYSTYDGHSRPVNILNYEKEIVQSYSYHDNLSDFCNHSSVSQIPRNNCPANQYSDGTYTYSLDECDIKSTVSQADADQQVLSLVSTTGQQEANTFCACTTCQQEGYKVINGICYAGTYVEDYRLPCTLPNDPTPHYYIHYHYHYLIDNSNEYFISDCVE